MPQRPNPLDLEENTQTLPEEHTTEAIMDPQEEIQQLQAQLQVMKDQAAAMMKAEIDKMRQELEETHAVRLRAMQKRQEEELEKVRKGYGKELTDMYDKMKATQRELREKEETTEELKEALEKEKMDKGAGVDPNLQPFVDAITKATEAAARDIVKRSKQEDRVGVKKLPPPVFKGLKGERPDAHLLRTNDWFSTIYPDMTTVTDADKIRDFRHTLDNLAREWYDGMALTGTWKKFSTEFSRYFSTQGRSMRQLHERWKHFMYHPDTDNIEEYIRDVQETAKQLNYDDDDVLAELQTTMPDAMYGQVIKEKSLTDLIRFLKEIYAKDERKKAATATSTVSTAPFSYIKDKMHEDQPDLTETIYKLADRFERFELKDRKPFKPYITPGGKGKVRKGFKGKNKGRFRYNNRGYNDNRGRYYDDNRGRQYDDNRYRNNNNRFRYRDKPRYNKGKFDKSPIVRKPRVNSKSIDKDKQDRCHNCKEMGHWARDCPQLNNRSRQQDNTYEDYTYLGQNTQYPISLRPQDISQPRNDMLKVLPHQIDQYNGIFDSVYPQELN